MKCSRSKTIRPIKLKGPHHVYLMRSTWCEFFSFLCLIVLDLKHFKVLGCLVFCLFTLYSPFMVSPIFLCLYYTDPFKIPSMNVPWEFYQNSRQAQKFKKEIKSLNNFWKQSMFTTLLWLSLNSLNLQERFWIVWKVLVLSGNFLENIEGLESFQIFWKVTKLSGKFPNVWKISRLSGKFPYCLKSFQIVCHFSTLSGKFSECLKTFQIVYKLFRLSGKLSGCLYLFQIV